jgi:esterase/lipase superfamily enzyme
MLTRPTLRAALLLATLILLVGCNSATTLPVTPNVLRDGSGSQVLAQLPPDQQKVDMPVVFVTDRAPFAGLPTAPRYGTQRSPSLAYGLATVSLEPSPTWEELVRASGSPSDEKPYHLTVSKIEEDGKILISPTSVEAYEGGLRFRPEAKEMIDQETQKLLDLVRARLAATSHKDVFIYVHGVDNTFEDAICRAAIMWHYTGRQGVFVAYAWPAGRGGAMGYFYDRESGEYTVLHLKRLIQRVAQIPEVERVHVIAHSRGGDISTTALRELNIEFRAQGKDPQKELKLETLLLAAPDLDVEVLGLRLILENMAVIAKKFVVYSSTKDKAVGLADWLFHSRARLGTLSKSEVLPEGQEVLASVPGVQLVQCVVSGFGTSHDYVFTNPGALSDLILVLRDRRNPGEANGRPLTPLGGAFWKLDNEYALPAAKPSMP